MKHFFTFCALALTLSLQLTAVRPANAQTTAPSASEILQKSLKTYSELQKYKGTCAVTSESVMTFAGSTQHKVDNARATFDFERGQRLSVEATSLTMQPLSALSTPGKTWIQSQLSPRSIVATDGPIAKEYTRETFANLDNSMKIEDIIEDLSALTNNAGSLVPIFLMGDSPRNPLRLSPGATLLPDQKVAGRDCYVVQHQFEQSKLTTIFWVEKSSFLLCRMQQEQQKQDMNATGLNYQMSLYIFINDQAN